MIQFFKNLWTLLTSKDEMKLHRALQSVHRRAWNAAWNCGWNRAHENNEPYRERSVRYGLRVEELGMENAHLRAELAKRTPKHGKDGKFTKKG